MTPEMLLVVAVIAVVPTFAPFVSAAGALPHDTLLVTACVESTTQAACCAAIFSAVEDGGITYLCEVHDTPSGIASGVSMTFFIDAYLDCGGQLPSGTDIDSVCIGWELPSGDFTPPSVPSSRVPAPADVVLSPPPPPSPPSAYPQEPHEPWLVKVIVKAVPIVAPLLTLLVLVGGLFYCIHRGGDVGNAASFVLRCLLNLITCFIARHLERPQGVPRMGRGFQGGVDARHLERPPGVPQIELGFDDAADPRDGSDSPEHQTQRLRPPRT